MIQSVFHAFITSHQSPVNSDHVLVHVIPCLTLHLCILALQLKDFTQLSNPAHTEKYLIPSLIID